MRAVIFDFDGVLVNSEPLHFKAMGDALLELGVRIGAEEYSSHYLAYDDRESMRIALERHGRAHDPEAVGAAAARKAEIFDAYLAEIPFFPGARDLVASLAEEVPLAIASGALRREIEAVLSQAGLRAAFAAVVGAEDCIHGKPDPEPYLRAFAALGSRLPGLGPGDCVVVEDSMPGVAAARAAGMKVLAVTHSFPASKFGAAHRVVDSLAGLSAAGLRALMED